MNLGPYKLANNLVLAPMAGITDRPFRELCRKFGAGLAVSEMVTSDKSLWQSRKSQARLDHVGEPGPISVQIVGTEPTVMAEAAQANVQMGADIIDINMGCPAKKVCSKAAGSALLRNEALVVDILSAVTTAVEVPVTLKIRTGWCPDSRNAVTIARIAEDLGIQALTVHGRTRACRFKGLAEYDSIAAVKQATNIPIIANGDINTPDKALYVLDYTGADAIMIGRGAQGKPWLFRETAHFLATNEYMKPPSMAEVRSTILEHIAELHRFYGDFLGLRIARKHMGWYMAHLSEGTAFSKHFNRLETAAEQIQQVEAFFLQSSNRSAFLYDEPLSQQHYSREGHENNNAA